jgi:ribosome-associated protein
LRGEEKTALSLLIVVRYRQENRSLARPEKLHPPEPEPFWLKAVQAAESKQARDVLVLDVRETTSFTDYFLIATGANTRQVQAIADGITQALKRLGEHPSSLEGYENAEWVLIDYGDFVIHIFSPKAREYYDLERLWRDAKRMKW